jgi:uncharacterized protein (DUF1778 family)
MRHSEAMKELIGVRVLTEEKRALTEAARKRGVTLSELVRDAAAEAARQSAA